MQPQFDRSLRLPNSPNARDLGGYDTVVGGRVRTGLVYRSGSVSTLTDVEVDRLARAGIDTVIDLRTAPERDAARDRIPAGARTCWCDVLGRSELLRAPGLREMSLQALMRRAYRDIAADPAATAANREAMARIRVADGPVLFHCSGGKDRTGWLAAVLLTVLEVPWDTVVHDYLLSNEYNRAAEEGVDVARGVRAEWLDTGFAAATEAFGDFDGYIRDGLGLGDADVKMLRGRLVE